MIIIFQYYLAKCHYDSIKDIGILNLFPVDAGIHFYKLQREAFSLLMEVVNLCLYCLLSGS